MGDYFRKRSILTQYEFILIHIIRQNTSYLNKSLREAVKKEKAVAISAKTKEYLSFHHKLMAHSKEKQEQHANNKETKKCN